MKPLFVLISVFIATLVFSGILGSWNYVLAGLVAMAAMLLFTAVGHFLFPTGMEMMMPDFVPFKSIFVFITGAFEVAAAIGIIIPSTREFTAICLIIFFILVLPVNINAAIKKINYEKADHSGKGIDYLWFRIPLQLVFLVWTWYFGILAD